MKDYDKIAHKIQEINPSLTDEVLGLLIEYFEARKNQMYFEFLESGKANDVIASMVEGYITKNYSVSS